MRLEKLVRLLKISRRFELGTVKWIAKTLNFTRELYFSRPPRLMHPPKKNKEKKMDVCCVFNVFFQCFPSCVYSIFQALLG